MYLAPVLLLLAQVRAPLSGMADDDRGRPVPDVEVVLAWGQKLDGSVPILARASTDDRGRFTITPPVLDQRLPGHTDPFLAAYREGSGLVATSTRVVKEEDSNDYRLAFHPARRRTFTIRDGGGQPLAGVRLAPIAVVVRGVGVSYVMLPDRLVDRLEATTGPDGRAELSCLEPATELMGLRASVPGLGTLVVAVPMNQFKSEVVAFDLKPAGAISGRVVGEDGKPVEGADVEVWSQMGDFISVPLRPVQFEAGPIRTDADGSFHTPAGLLAGMPYRALVRARGFQPVLTEWVRPEAGAPATAALTAVVLRPPHAVAGRVIDRQGRAVAGAEVVAAGESASAVTDHAGRFRLAGLASNRPFVVVRHDGFRIDGRWLAAREGELEVVLARFDEPAARTMTTVSSSPIPPEERRRLARRLLEPYLVKVLAQGRDGPKSWALRSLMFFDPGAALEALERTTFQDTESYQSMMRRDLALALARDDPEEAAAVATSIPKAVTRAHALVDLCLKLPDDQRARKRALIDQALVAAKAEPEPRLKMWQLGEAAELLLDLGEADQARAIFAEGRALAAQLDSRSGVYLGYFASRLARVDLPAALALLGGIDRAASRPTEFGNVAARIAASQPAEAERLAGMLREATASSHVTYRICQNMARTDLARARRIALAHPSPVVRSGSLIFAAYGLPPSERSAARDLVREALGEIDRTRDQVDVHVRSSAIYMPLVESIDPALVPEFFWRAIADLAVHNDPRVGLAGPDVLREPLLLARYDASVATALFERVARAAAARETDTAAPLPGELTLIAAIDPRRAVAIVEAMPDPGDLEHHGANSARTALAARLAGDPIRQWSGIWSTYSGLGGVLDQRDVR